MTKNEHKKRFFETVLQYKPLPKQAKFHYSPKKFRGYIGGLGSGKSYGGVCESLYQAHKYKHTLGVILAPTVRMLKDSTMRTFFDVCPPELIEKRDRTNNSVTLICGTEILFRNCEDIKSVERLRNMEIAWFWIDEAGITPYYAWQVLVGRLRQKGGPLLGWTTSTPKGFTWLYKKFAESPTNEYFYVTSTSHENIHLPEGYVATLEQEYTGVFREQEIFGKFVGFEGLVYSTFSRSVHIKPIGNKKFKEVIAGVDWGFTNPMAII
ncbi:hypothetical protein LCGC14_2064000, partial [marine sediment metagenome]